MATERPVSSENPRTEFSFFPDPNEKEYYKVRTTAGEVLEAMSESPQLKVQILHEFWGIGKDEMVYDAMKKDHQKFMKELILNTELAQVLSFAVYSKGESIDNCQAFLESILTSFAKVGTFTPFGNNLPEVVKPVVDQTVGEFVRDINTLVDFYNSKLPRN